MTTMLTAARAEALFTSQLATGSDPSHEAVDNAIRLALRTHGGVRGCAADVAAEYGDHPELAVPRMRWALDQIDHQYAARRPHRGQAFATTRMMEAPPALSPSWFTDVVRL